MISVFYCASDMIITSQVMCARGLSTDSLYEIWLQQELKESSLIRLFVRASDKSLSRALSSQSSSFGVSSLSQVGLRSP